MASLFVMVCRTTLSASKRASSVRGLAARRAALLPVSCPRRHNFCSNGRLTRNGVTLILYSAERHRFTDGNRLTVVCLNSSRDGWGIMRMNLQAKTKVGASHEESILVAEPSEQQAGARPTVENKTIRSTNTPQLGSTPTPDRAIGAGTRTPAHADLCSGRLWQDHTGQRVARFTSRSGLSACLAFARRRRQ